MVLEIRNGFSLYPNPAKDVVTISSKENIKTIKIMNQLDQTIQQLNNPTEHQTINTKQLVKGVYIVQMITKDGNHFATKLVIEK